MASGVLQQKLKLLDLTALGIAAIIGAGIYSTIGMAAYEGGPAVVYLFLITAVACLFSALCYASFASRFPVSGSAYTYTFLALGKIPAWIIGWDLLMEYAIGNIAVAISWSDYFTHMVHQLGFQFPAWLSTDYLSAQNYATNLSLENKSAWLNAPALGNFKIIFDLPALTINLLITIVVLLGIKESKNVSNALVVFKLVVLLLIIAVGSFYINVDHYSPFMPNGWSGVLNGTAAVFFAYIGFDAISTTAEECVNPQQDLPKAILLSLAVCTFLYIALSLVLTGVVHYSGLNVTDPLVHIFEKTMAQQIGDYYWTGWLNGFIAISALIALSSVLLVFQLGQPRIFMAMSRDGLLPSKFAKIHPRFGTPYFSTIVTGLMVGVPILFLNHKIVTDLCAIGTLFAFFLVCLSELLLKNPDTDGAKFRVPFISSVFTYPIIALTILFSLFYYKNQAHIQDFSSSEIVLAFLLVLTTVLSIVYNLSLIPLLGCTINVYLMAQLGVSNWIRFGVWLLVGAFVYFVYQNYKKRYEKST